MKKIIKKLLIIILAIIIPFSIATFVKADSGWDTDYGGGGYDGGGYDGGGYDGGGYDSSGNGTYNDKDTLIVFGIIFGFPAIVSISILWATGELFPFKRRNDNQSNSITKSTRTSKSSQTSIKYNEMSVEKLKELIPDMTIEKLKNMVYSNFVDIQNAWMNFDYDKLRELCTDELFNTYKAQLETLKLKKGKNIMSSFEMVEVKIIDAKVENEIIILTTYLCVNFYDYVINTETKKVIRGSKYHLVHNNYILTFVKSSKPGNKKKNNKCPNCGTPIKNNASNVCENCKSTIVKDSEEFVLSTKKIIN